MRRLVALSLLALQLTLVAPTFAVSAAPDGVSVPADCAGDETVVCGLIPPWGNGEMIFGLPEGASGPGLVLRPFPDNQRPWRLCLKGEFGPEWSLAPCDTLPITGGLEDFTQICVGRNEMVNCLLGGNDDFIGPVHFVWDGKIDIDVLSEGVPYQYKLAYQVPNDCGDRYTICGLLPPWGNTIQVERIVPLDREQGFTLIKEAVPAAQNAHAPTRVLAHRSGRSTPVGRSTMTPASRHATRWTNRCISDIRVGSVVVSSHSFSSVSV